MLTALVCPECRGNIQLDDEKEFGFCLYCGCKVVLTDNLKTKVVITHDTELEATRKLLSKYLKQKDWNGVLECCRTIVKYDITDWRAWLVVASHPQTPSMWHIGLENAIEHCDKPDLTEYLKNLKEKCFLVLLSHYQCELNVAGQTIPFSLPMLFDKLTFCRDSGFYHKLDSNNILLLVDSGEHSYYDYNRESSEYFTVDRDMSVFFNNDLKTTLTTANDIEVYRYPSVGLSDLDPSTPVDKFTCLRKRKVLIDKPEDLDKINIYVDGKKASIESENGVSFFYAGPESLLFNGNEIPELRSSVTVKGTSDVRLVLKEKPVTYKRRVSLLKSETVNATCYELTIEDIPESFDRYIGFGAIEEEYGE